MRAPLSVALVLALACGDDDEPAPATTEPATEEPAAARAPLPAPEPMVVAGAQTLIVAGEDVLWFVGGPPRSGGGLRVRTLGPLGQADGPWRDVVPAVSGQPGSAPHVVEVAAVMEADRLAVAWVERDQLTVRTRAVRGDAGGRAFGRPLELPERSFDPQAAARGSVAVEAVDGHVDVLFREGDGPCEASGSTRCSRFARTRLGEGAPSRGLGWSLPEPCPAPLVGALTFEGVDHHALCAVEEGQPTTTVFGVQFEPQYAHAEKVLPGCTPVGLVPFAGAVALTGDCPDARRGVLVRDVGRSLQPMEGPEVRCDQGRPVVRWGAHEETLAAPRGDLGPLLPAALASAEDVAVWTGEALLVAHAREGEATIRRFACDRGTVARTDG